MAAQIVKPAQGSEKRERGYNEKVNAIRQRYEMGEKSENRAERDSSYVYWKVKGVRNFE